MSKIFIFYKNRQINVQFFFKNKYKTLGDLKNKPTFAPASANERV